MSWHYLQEQAVASSDHICWDGARFAPSKSMTTLGRYCWPDKPTAIFPYFPSGMTLRRSTDTNGAGVLTWYQGASPVRIYLAPEGAPELTEPVADCGPSSPGSLARYNPGSRSWKTRQRLLFAGLTEFSGTWPRWGTMRGGEFWAHDTPVLPIDGTAFGSWPTPTKVAAWGNLPEERTRWNGPAAYVDGVKRNTDLDQFCEHLGRLDLSESMIFREWLMGWPIGQTDLKPLAMDRFRQWSDLHGKH